MVVDIFLWVVWMVWMGLGGNVVSHGRAWLGHEVDE